jgi:dihydrofolate reductase
MSANRVIGLDNKIPWNIPEEMQFFKKITLGGNLIMGRKTYESIKRTCLPFRDIYTLTNFNKYGWTKSEFNFKEGKSCTYIINSLNDLPEQDFFVCGGATIYSQLLSQISEFFVSKLHENYEGNVFMPPFEHLFKKQEVILKSDKFETIRYFN